MPCFVVVGPMSGQDLPTIVQGAFRCVEWRDLGDARKEGFRQYVLPM